MTETDWSAAFVAEFGGGRERCRRTARAGGTAGCGGGGSDAKGTASAVKRLPGTNRLSFAPASAPSVCERLLSQARTDLLLPQPVVSEIEYG